MKLSVFWSWIPLAIAIIGINGVIYLAVQQNYRQNAYDPQIQISEDIANALSNGADPKSVVPANAVDLSKSLATFVILYNDAGQPSTSSASLDGRTPTPPTGVFDYAKANHQDRLTWAPRPEIRLATIVTSYSGAKSGYVLVGRSMREVESRTERLLQQIAGATAALLLVTLVAIYIFDRRKN